MGLFVEDFYRAMAMPKTRCAPCSLSVCAQAAIVAPDAATSSMIQNFFRQCQFLPRSMYFPVRAIFYAPLVVGRYIESLSIFSCGAFCLDNDICGVGESIRVRTCLRIGRAISLEDSAQWFRRDVRLIPSAPAFSSGWRGTGMIASGKGSSDCRMARKKPERQSKVADELIFEKMNKVRHADHGSEARRICHHAP